MYLYPARWTRNCKITYWVTVHLQKEVGGVVRIQLKELNGLWLLYDHNYENHIDANSNPIRIF